MTWTGNVSPVMRQKSKGVRPARNAARRAARRYVVPGFPIEPRPLSLEEIAAYFSGDRITCMLCGKSYRRLSAGHLHQIHSVTEDEYKAMFGLPWRRGLTSALSHDTYSREANRKIADGAVIPCSGDVLKERFAGHTQRPRQPFRAEVCLQNLGEHAVTAHAISRDVDRAIRAAHRRSTELVEILEPVGVTGNEGPVCPGAVGVPV